MPASVTTAYATSNLNPTTSQRKPALALPTGLHATALPLYGEYVVDSPAAIGAATTVASSLSPDQEDYVFCDPVAPLASFPMLHVVSN